ncbi:MAG: hypothetical protein RBU37_22420 [Myxococcota bacterium]|jgi:hypothetical protein|nr:hypothetical protein [Myxococcota bacterium]
MRPFIIFLALIVSSALFLSCDKAKDENKAKEEAAESGPNPFQVRKDMIEDYMKTVEGAADLAAAVAAGQAWLDKNLDAYKDNCKLHKEYAGDAKKSKMAKGIDTPFDDYVARLTTKAGGNPMEATGLLEQFNSFFNCMALN